MNLLLSLYIEAKMAWMALLAQPYKGLLHRPTPSQTLKGLLAERGFASLSAQKGAKKCCFSTF